MNTQEQQVAYAEYIGESPELDRMFAEVSLETPAVKPAEKSVDIFVPIVATIAGCVLLFVILAFIFRRRRAAKKSRADMLLQRSQLMEQI